MSYDGYRAMIHESLEVPTVDRVQASRAHWWAVSLDAGWLIEDDGLQLVEVKTYLSRGIRTYTFEGDRLPGWVRGTDPKSLPTWEALRQYRSLRRIYDIRWPDDVALSSSVVMEIIDSAGRTPELRGLTFTGRKSYIVDRETEEEVRFYGAAAVNHFAEIRR